MTYENYNPATRKRTWRQIWLLVVAPLALTFLCIFAATWALDSTAGGRYNAPVSQIATMFFVTLMCLCNLMVLGVIGGLAFVPYWLMRKLPPGFKKVHDILLKVQHQTNRATNVMANSVIRAHAAEASTRRFIQAVQPGASTRRPDPAAGPAAPPEVNEEAGRGPTP